MKRSWSIVWDDREKRPLRFPPYLVMRADRESRRTTTVQLLTVSRRLPIGDYLLEEAPQCVVIERKASLEELATNLFSSRRRKNFQRELQALSVFRHPILLVEGSPYLLSRTGFFGDWTPPLTEGVVRDALFDMLMEYQIGLMVIPSGSSRHRDKAAEWVASAMIRGAIHAALQESSLPDAD